MTVAYGRPSTWKLNFSQEYNIMQFGTCRRLGEKSPVISRWQRWGGKETAGFSKPSLPVYHTARRHNPKYNNLLHVTEFYLSTWNRGDLLRRSGVPIRGGGCLGVSNPPPKLWRPSKIVSNSTRLCKLLKIAECRTPTPQDVRKKGSKNSKTF